MQGRRNKQIVNAGMGHRRNERDGRIADRRTDTTTQPWMETVRESVDRKRERETGSGRP